MGDRPRLPRALRSSISRAGADRLRRNIWAEHCQRENPAELHANYQHRHSFELWDDDRILNASGTLFWNGQPDSPDDDNDDFVYGPLRDFGGPALGCVRVAYPGRPGWDCG